MKMAILCLLRRLYIQRLMPIYKRTQKDSTYLSVTGISQSRCLASIFSSTAFDAASPLLAMSISNIPSAKQSINKRKGGIS